MTDRPISPLSRPRQGFAAGRPACCTASAVPPRAGRNRRPAIGGGTERRRRHTIESKSDQRQRRPQRQRWSVEPRVYTAEVRVFHRSPERRQRGGRRQRRGALARLAGRAGPAGAVARRMVACLSPGESAAPLRAKMFSATPVDRRKKRSEQMPEFIFLADDVAAGGAAVWPFSPI